MVEIKNDKYFLEKIIADLEFLIEHTSGKSEDEIVSDPLLMDSICFRLIQIAENNEKLSSEFKANNAVIPWKAIKGMRNRIVHDYGFIDPTIVYVTVSESVPDLYIKLKNLL